MDRGYDQEKTQAPMGDDYRAKQIFDRDRAERGSQCDRIETASTAGQLGRAYSDAEILAQVFSYHPPTPHTLLKFQAINQAAKNFAEVILQNCPRGTDRAQAIELIRVARMMANAAVALNGVSVG